MKDVDILLYLSFQNGKIGKINWITKHKRRFLL